MGDLPRTLNLGSGRDFRDDCLNVDRDPAWRPDVVADLEAPFPGATRWFDTDRFGRIELAPESFTHIVAHDLLEHLRELTTLMRSCRDLLQVGGVLDVLVPYDLSLGAWQDPTHVRAFNERSWLYYGAWCWYLGWDDFHLPTRALELVLGEVGKRMHSAGASQDEILRTPRAVEALHVLLVKAPVPEDLRAECRSRHVRTSALGR